MMKYLKPCVFVCALLCSAMASAQTYSYLTLRKASGEEQSLAIEGLKITFSDGNLVAANREKTTIVPLSEMGRLYFSATPTSIASASRELESPSARIVNGRLQVEAPAGTLVAVYGMDGRRMPLEGLQRGIYVVKVGSKTLKVIAR